MDSPGGMGFQAGTGGAATASAKGTVAGAATVTVLASATGGAGGVGYQGAYGGGGGAATLTNGVAGSTLGGVLNLTQTALGGAGGTSSAVAGGSVTAGAANSSLTFDDTANANQSATGERNLVGDGRLGQR